MKPYEYQSIFENEERHWYYVGLRYEIRQMLRRFTGAASPGLCGVKVLDAGCGTGGLLAHLSRMNGPWGAGVEIAQEGLTLSRSRGVQRLLQGSVNALPVKPEQFDAIVSIDVLCHLGVDEPQALREFARVLKPGGVMILQLPAFEWLRSEHDAAVSTRRRYSSGEVKRLVTDAGLTVRRSGYRNTMIFPVAAILRRCKRHRAQVQTEDAVSDLTPLPALLNAFLLMLSVLETVFPLNLLRSLAGVEVFCVATKPRVVASDGTLHLRTISVQRNNTRVI